LGDVLQTELRGGNRKGIFRYLNPRIESPIKEPVYPIVRRRILTYCCEEALSPDQLCQFLEAPIYHPNYLGQMIAADLPLQRTYQAYRLGWER
jgi:hypothetical protein